MTTPPPSSSWSVFIAQFLPPPSLLHAASPSLNKLRNPHHGAWLCSSDAATLTLSPTAASTPCLLALILRGRVHEEHFVSTLAFTWPQVRHAGECSAAGTRVIFASYRPNSFNVVRKFAMQFQSVLEAKTFFEILRNIITVEKGHPTGPFSCAETQQRFLTGQDLLKDGFTTSWTLPNNGSTSSIGHTFNTHHSFEMKVCFQPKFATPFTSSTTDNEQRQLPISSLQFKAGQTTNLIDPHGTVNITDSIIQKNFLQLPPRFPCSSIQPYTSLSLPCNGHERGVSGSTLPPNEVQTDDSATLKEQIMACFLDPKFQVFVAKVEKIWHELEKDLAGEIFAINSFACPHSNSS